MARPGKPVAPPDVATAGGRKVGGGPGGREDGGGPGGEPKGTEGRVCGASSASAPGRGSGIRTPCVLRFVDLVSTGGIRAIGGNTMLRKG
jgi:hypothetical protein